MKQRHRGGRWKRTYIPRYQSPGLHKETGHCRSQPVWGKGWHTSSPFNEPGDAVNQGERAAEITEPISKRPHLECCPGGLGHNCRAPFPAFRYLAVPPPHCREVPEAFRWLYKNPSSNTCCLPGREKTVTFTGKRPVRSAWKSYPFPENLYAKWLEGKIPWVAPARGLALWGRNGSGSPRGTEETSFGITLSIQLQE